MKAKFVSFSNEKALPRHCADLLTDNLLECIKLGSISEESPIIDIAESICISYRDKKYLSDKQAEILFRSINFIYPTKKRNDILLLLSSSFPTNWKRKLAESLQVD